MIKVLIADDEAILGESLRLLLERDPEIAVVGCARDGDEALRLCGELRPDIVLMDIVMPGCDGITATRRIKEEYDGIKILILTTFHDDERLSQALQFGADGYLLKDVTPVDLCMAVKSVYRGIGVLSRPGFDLAARPFRQAAPVETRSAEAARSLLTERDLDIIGRIVEGMSNKEIAAALGLTEGSVRNAVSAVLAKLQLQDRTQLAIYAIRHKLV